jgi:hypothetical protein
MRGDPKYTPAQLDELRARHPVDEYAAGLVALRSTRRGQWTHAGPCPLCSQRTNSKSAGRFECNGETWVCAVCHENGDIISLVRAVEGVGYFEAIERLGGVRAEEINSTVALRAGRRDYETAAVKTDAPATVPVKFAVTDPLRDAYLAGWLKAASAAAASIKYRARERDRLLAWWNAGAHWRGTPVAAYLSGRGLLRPSNAQLRYHGSIPLFCDGREREPVLVHRGPAMLAAIWARPDEFIGLHITWLDPAGPKGKAECVSPIDGEVLPSKKVRGTKAGGYIDLGGCDEHRAVRLIAGEGIETVYAAFTGLVRNGRDVSRTMLRSSVDIGNLAGKALAMLPHPTARAANNRPQRVPGPDPDLSSPAMPLPATISEAVFLGDGDSDPFFTRNALERAKRRHQRDGLHIGTPFAESGSDFNDMIPASAGDEMQDEATQ